MFTRDCHKFTTCSVQVPQELERFVLCVNLAPAMLAHPALNPY